MRKVETVKNVVMICGVVLLCAASFGAGWLANRRRCNIEAYLIGFEQGQYDGMTNAAVGDVVVIPAREAQ